MNDNVELPQGDLISRAALKEAIRKRLCISSLKYLTEQEKVIVEEIDNAQAVDISGNEYFPFRTAYFYGVEAGRATARPKGKWLFKPNSSDIWCSVCDENFDEIPQAFDFCPNCGADMRKGGKE